MPSTNHSVSRHGVKTVFRQVGLINCSKIADTLQGSVWSAFKKRDDTRSEGAQHGLESVVIKVTSKVAHEQHVVIGQGQKVFIKENIKKEAKLLKYSTKQKNAPKSIIKYIDFFKTNKNYYLLMENGGGSLFEFVVRAHKLIQNGTLDVCEWHKFIKIIFKQMIEAINYLHSLKISHFDISLENFLINDVDVISNKKTGKIRFCYDNVQVKLCDFGLAEVFGESSPFLNNKYCGKPNYKSPEIVTRKKLFDARANDVWCLGICLFMMIIGGQPWQSADINSNYLLLSMMNADDDNRQNCIIKLIENWDRLNYVDSQIICLFSSMFQYEESRITVDEIKNHSWLK